MIKVRIISGRARGMKLYTLEGTATRPTLDRVKESLFNIIGFEVQNSNFFDVFSGSGAIALEAASRGAKNVIACDNSKEACEIIKKNMEKTHLEDVVQLHQKTYLDVIKEKQGQKQDLVFIDPPFKEDYGIIAMEEMYKANMINLGTIIIIETDDNEKYIKTLEDKFEVEKIKKYGKIYLIVFRLRKDILEGDA